MMHNESDPGVETTTAAREDDVVELPTREAAPLVEQDMLVEDVSIDGMCGVY